MRTFFVVTLAGAVAITSGLRVNAAPDPASRPETTTGAESVDRASMREAKMLADAHRYREAAEIYEGLLKKTPGDAFVLARLASVLASQADLEEDARVRKDLYLRARSYAEQAEKLGTTDPVTPFLLASIKPDGSKTEVKKGSFSTSDQVDALMREGEAAYAKHDFAKASECHAKAFELEPTNYNAALLAGDAYFGAKDMIAAAEWFRKAIAVNPDAEIAHRYLGDALQRLGRNQEAFAEKLTALICDPYQRTTRQHFPPELRVQAEQRGRVIPRFPAMRSKIEGKQIKLAVNPSDGIVIMAYSLCAVGWREENFAKNYPAEKTPRRSLLEEVAAIDGMLEAVENAKEENQAEIKKWKPVIEGLQRLKKEGLLEAYILLERADSELAKDYVGYRAQNREKLERYVRLYWCGLDEK